MATALAACVAACGTATSPPAESLAEAGPHDASYDGALAFDGVDDYASLGTARAPHIKRDQTIMLWFRAEGPVAGGGSLQVLFSLRRGDDSGFALALDDDVPLAYRIFANRDLARAASAVSRREWHHLAFLIRAEQSLLFVDGAEAAASASELTNRTPTQAFLGSENGFDHPFHGALDDLRVYERALTAEEVSAAAAGEPPGEAELVVIHLPLDEVSGARAFDRSGLGNHAELGDGVPSLMPERIPR